MIKNLWRSADICCLNHKKPVKMEFAEKHSLINNDNINKFYACPKYMRKDEKHPNGHEDDEQGCNNRLSFIDAEKILDKFSDIIEEDRQNNEFGNYTNLRFKHKGIDVCIIEDGISRYKVGVLNRRAMDDGFTKL